MYSKKADIIYLIVSLAGFLIFAISFLLMPVGSKEITQEFNTVNLIAGLMFWVGLLAGTISQILLSVGCKRWLRSENIDLSLVNQPKIGLISFFRNKTAIIFDIIMILSLIGFAATAVVTDATGYACYIFIALFSFSFCAHCIFNGRSYYFIENSESIKRKNEKSKTDVNG